MVTQVMSEVEKIVVSLTEKHSKDYTVEHIRAWAHMVQMGKHLFYNEPPEKPFFKKKVKNDKRPSQLISLLALPTEPKRKLLHSTKCGYMNNTTWALPMLPR